MNDNITSNNKPLVFFSVITFFIGQLIPFLSFLLFPFDTSNHPLNYPSIYPQTWVFVLIWIILYPCIGLSMGHIYKLRKRFDISGVLTAFIIMLTANLMFTPIMNLSEGNPGIMTFLDFNGIVSASLFSWLCFKYSKKAFYWSLPLTIWMPITFILKVTLWAMN